MKKLCIFLCFISLSVLLPTYSFASLIEVTELDSGRTVTEYDYVDQNATYAPADGTFLGVFEGNDSNQLSDIETWLGGGITLVEENKEDYVTGTKYGTWAVTPAVSFYVVKAGNAFALYELDPALNSIDWNTWQLWIRGYGGSALEISHISGYNDSNPVPIPSTIGLLGVGILGLAGVRRKK